jgi:hypothetical protein
MRGEGERRERRREEERGGREQERRERERGELWSSDRNEGCRWREDGKQG